CEHMLGKFVCIPLNTVHPNIIIQSGRRWGRLRFYGRPLCRRVILHGQIPEAAMNECPSRRQFAQALAVLAAGAGAPALADEVAAPSAKEYVEALNVVIRYRFGMHLSEEQLKRVHASALRGRASGEVLKRVELANGDDPVVAFRADLP